MITSRSSTKCLEIASFLLAVSRRCSIKKVFWKKLKGKLKQHSFGGVLSKKVSLNLSENSQKKHLCQNIFLNKVADNLKLYLKRDSNSCEFCEFFKSDYFVEHLWTAVSETSASESPFYKVASPTAWRPVTLLERRSSTGIFLWILRNFPERVFAENLLATTSDVALSSFLFADKWSLQPKNNLFCTAKVN